MTTEPQQNKYTVKPKKKLHSRFLLQQEMKEKEKEKEAALLLEQQKVNQVKQTLRNDESNVLKPTSRGHPGVYCWECPGSDQHSRR